MKITTRLDVIKFNDIELHVNDVLKTLIKLPVEDLVKFLTGPKYFSRRDYATVLKNVMRDEVWKFKLVSRVAEKGLAHDFYSRLDFFEDSPVTVLENLFTKMVKIQPELIDRLLEDMWLFALQAVEGKNNELIALIKKGEKAATSKIVIGSLFATIGSIFKDELGDIDGVLINEFTKKGLNSATLKELRDMGDSLGVALPISITKQDIFDGIIAVLPSVAKAKDIPAITEDLQDMTVADLKAFVTKYKLDVPIELKKADVGELLVNGFVNKHAKDVNDSVKFNLPERIDESVDFSDENPKIVRLSARVKELEAELAEKPKVVEKVVEKEVVKEVVKNVTDDKAVSDAQAKVTSLEEELAATKSKLDAQPKEVVKEVVKEIPGPTIIRTVISKKELLKQKEKYEAIIAEQEKERAILLSRSDEQDEIMAKYEDVKEQLARKEAELDHELSRSEDKLPVQPVEKAPVVEAQGYGDLGAIHVKMDRLVDKMHEMQLEMVRSENRRLEQELARARHIDAPAVVPQEEERSESEVNLFFDSNLAKRMMSENETGGKKRRPKRRRRKMHWLPATIIWLVVLALIVFIGGWALVHFGVAPLTYGPAWLLNITNNILNFLYGIVDLVVKTVVGWWQLFIGLFSRA